MATANQDWNTLIKNAVSVKAYVRNYESFIQITTVTETHLFAPHCIWYIHETTLGSIRFWT